jgi:CRISPR-associated protein Cmr3
MMKLFLTPVDVWLFRDGRPFDAGDDHYARSLFPPYPSVIQGAIRSHHLVVKGVNLQDKQAIVHAVGTADDFGALRMRGPFIARRQANGRGIVRYFPLPADAVPHSADCVQAALPQSAAARRVSTNFDSHLPLLLFPRLDQPVKQALGNWLDEAQLMEYLDGKPVSPIRAETLFVLEHRYGIGLESAARAAKEGLLYAAEFVRPAEGVGLYVEVSGFDGWPAQGVMRIGGEGRAARFEQVAAPDWPTPPDPLPRRFKLYFASPTYFEGGWRPRDWSRFFDGQVLLQAVALSRYEVRGGFDWANGLQKPARRYVPAGSVYYFECQGEARLRPDLVQNAITDYGAQIGFGQVIVTNWEASS